jgi:predicted nucleotidyltransferase
MDLMEKCEEIARKISKNFDISYALLFGSSAFGYRRKDSDVDIAVKLKRNKQTFEQILKIIAVIENAFERELGIETEVIILNQANPGLIYEIFSHGKMIYCENPHECIEDRVGAVEKFLDFKIVLENYFTEIKRSMGW